MNHKQKEDSAFRTRLLRYLAGHGIRTKRIERIRKNVFLIETLRGRYFFKGFSSKRKYELQKALTFLLKGNGFTKTYSFLYNIPPLEDKGLYYGFIEYLPPHNERFSFIHKENRDEGLLLLDGLHRISQKFAENKSLRTMSRFDQIAKWTARLSEFELNTKVIEEFLPHAIIKKAVKDGRWALKGLKEQQSLLYNGPVVILHGDVAHHNFLRTESGELYLIDWDLAAKGPAIFDYLQYANRILPFISFSSKELWSHKILKKYHDDLSFLYALAYPSDIYREWNRLIRENLLGSQVHLHNVWRLTVEGFEQRAHFTKELEQRIRKLQTRKN